MTYAFTYPYTYYHGTGSSREVPGQWPVALAGLPMMVDTAPRRIGWAWDHESIQLLKPQQDASAVTAEVSLNPEGLWRRAEESFHHGAGQVWHDKPNADEFQYRSSKGVDPWTPYELSVLPDTTHSKTSANARLMLEPAGNRLYYSDNDSLFYTTDLVTYTPVTGITTINGIASDGHNVYIASGINGVYKTDTTLGAASAWVTGNVRGTIGYCNGRLMVSDRNVIYNITAAGALPTPLFTHDNTDFQWVGFTAGQVAIYTAGWSGDKSLVYRIPIKDDGTGLNPPIPAAPLPDGEIITSIGSYLGFIVLGTTHGVRFCESDSTGNLNIGAAIPAPSPLAFEGQDKYVWFGWSNYDTESTGLGRFSIESFTTNTLTDARVPAYASDLMAPGQGAVTSVATFLNKRVFTVAGQGVWSESDGFTTEATFDSGCFGFGIPDEKVALFIDVRCDPIVPAGRYDVFLSTDNDAFVFVGFDDNSGSTGTQFATSRPAGDHFEVRLTLAAPMTVTRFTLKASSGATDGPNEFINVPFLLRRVLDVGGRDEKFDVHYAREHIKRLFRNHTTVKYQEGFDVYDVIVNSYQWFPDNFTNDPGGSFDTPDGIMLTQLKVVN